MPDSNIIQIDQNLFETKLDRLVTEKMTQILNAMLDAEADEDHRGRQIRTQGGAQGVQGRPLRTHAHGKGGQARAQGAETQGRGLRIRGHRTLPQAGVQRRGGVDGDVPGGSEHPSGRRHQQTAVG